MIDNDDVRFSTFTRDLARRQRRPRSYPASPARADALEQLCGGTTPIPPAASSTAVLWTLAGATDLTDLDLHRLVGEDDEPPASIDSPS